MNRETYKWSRKESSEISAVTYSVSQGVHKNSAGKEQSPQQMVLGKPDNQVLKMNSYLIEHYKNYLEMD